MKRKKPGRSEQNVLSSIPLFVFDLKVLSRQAKAWDVLLLIHYEHSVNWGNKLEVYFLLTPKKSVFLCQILLPSKRSHPRQKSVSV